MDAHQRHLAKLGRAGDARAAILEHLEWDQPREDEFAHDVRIVLVSANFSTEITSTVMWLNERDLDIRCVRVQSYRLEERRWFLDDDELLYDATSTFAFSNQWSGPAVLPMIDRIAEAYPELRISYEARSA